MHQFTSSLRYTDQSWWSQEPTYSRMIAGVLDRGYRLVRQGDSQLDDFGRAASVAENHLQSRMSPHQRLRLYFVLAKANAGVSWFEDAIGWLDQTRSLAMQLSDLDMQLELLSLRATYKIVHDSTSTMLLQTAWNAWISSMLRPTGSASAIPLDSLTSSRS